MSDFKDIFKGKNKKNRYPTGEAHLFLFNLIKHFELGFELSDTKRLIIPHLLSVDQPAGLPVFEPEHTLRLKFVSKQSLPPYTISRFIVRHHRQIVDTDSIWRFGVILRDGKGSSALVIEKDRTITVSVKGKQKTAFIGEIRKTLKDLFDDYKGQKPGLEYEVRNIHTPSSELSGELEAQDELFVPESYIIQYLKSNADFIAPDNGKLISLTKIPRLYNLVININNPLISTMKITNSNFNAKTQQFADQIINNSPSLSENDRKILQIIDANVSSEEGKKELITHLEVLEAEDASESEKKKAGGQFKNILDSMTKETGKLITKEIFENGAEWIRYLGM